MALLASEERRMRDESFPFSDETGTVTVEVNGAIRAGARLQAGHRRGQGPNEIRWSRTETGNSVTDILAKATLTKWLGRFKTNEAIRAAARQLAHRTTAMAAMRALVQQTATGVRSAVAKYPLDKLPADP
jgi:hypothetical protein